MLHFGATKRKTQKKGLRFGATSLYPATRDGLNFGTNSLQIAGSSLDLDFAKNRVYGASDFASVLNTTRNSLAYAADSADNWIPFDVNTPRITDKGLLVEESRINEIRNNSMQGAVVGTPGTLPTGMGISLGGGVSRQVVAFGTKSNGRDYLRLRLWTPTVTSDNAGCQVLFETTQTNIAALNGESWSSSFWASLFAGSVASLSSLRPVMSTRDASNVQITFVTGIDLKPIINATPFRVTQTHTIADAACAYINPRLFVGHASGVSFDITLDLEWPQMEKGAFVTSPIRTTGIAGTRNADTIKLVNPLLYSNLAVGAAFVEWEDPYSNIGTDRRLFTQRVDVNNQLAGKINQSNGKVQFFLNNAGVNQVAIDTANLSLADSRNKMSCRWATNDCAARFSAALGGGANDTSATMLTGAFDTWIGNSNGGSSINGYIRRLALFQNTLNDSRLEELVA